MLNLWNLHKLEEKPSDGPPAGGGMPLPPAAVPPVPPAEPPAPANPPPAEEGGDKFDQYGYEKDPAAPPKEGDPPAAPKAGEPEKIADPATGYGDEPPKVDDPPAPPADPAAPPAAPDDIDKALDGLVKEEATKIKEFIKKHGVSTEVAKAFAEMRKQEMKEAEEYSAKQQKEIEQNTLRLKAAWHKELKEDPTFGGEKFAKNVQNVEKVMAEFMPLTKKTLTERKVMLPPYLMRDLAKIADHLYATERLVQGDPATPAKVVKEPSALDFYE